MFVFASLFWLITGLVLKAEYRGTAVSEVPFMSDK